MKQKLLKAILVALVTVTALNCGPGNGSKPYTGNSYIFIKVSGMSDYTSFGVDYYIEDVIFTVYEQKLKWDDGTGTYQIDDSAPAVPVPNIKVKVCLELKDRTLQNYANDAPTLSGDDKGEMVLGLGCLEFASDFYGQVTPIVWVPSQFDGALRLKGFTISSSDAIDINIKFDSGTTCTDGEDNDEDGFTDAADADCQGPDGPFVNE